MPLKYLLGIDIGTQGTKTALFSQDGIKAADAFEPSRLIEGSKGEVHQVPDEIYGSVLRTISKVMEKSGVDPQNVIAIGIDGQMAGVLGIDKDWNAVTYYDSWLDTRCEKQIAEIKEIAEEEVISITGCPVTYAHGPKILWWKQERPDIYRRIDKFIMPSTYVTGRMAGLKSENAYIDYTHLHFSGYGNVEKMEWSDKLLQLFGIDKNKLPEIVEPWKIVGHLSKEAAIECHLTEGIPMVAGCGDSAATSLAAGVTQKGIVFDVAGTASIFSCCVDQYKPDIRNKTLLFPRSVIPGLWAPMAYINGGGLCLHWFRDNLAGGEAISYADLDKEAENVSPGSNGLIFLPHFSGRVCPNNPNVRGSWMGLNWAHKREHLYRAIMEGIAYEYAYYLKVIRSLIKDVEFSRVCAIGGGAKSNLFNTIKADVLGMDYTTLHLGDTAPLGSALVAGYGIGLYKDLRETANKLVRIDKTISHDMNRNKAYARYAEAYEKVFAQIGPTFKAIAE